MKNVSEEKTRFKKIMKNAVEVFMHYLEEYKCIENIPKQDFQKLYELFEFLDAENEKCIAELEICKKKFH